MDRRKALRALAGAAGGLVAGVAHGQDRSGPGAKLPSPGFDTAKIVIARLRGELFTLTGPGGNIAVLRGGDGLLLVDSGVAGRTDGIRAALADLTDRPVRLLVNTHWHADHTGGNEGVARAGAAIVAHANVRTRLSADQTNAFFGMKTPAAPPAARPAQTFSDAMTLYRNGEEVHVFHVRTAHTDGDAVVHFKKANVVHAGDLYFSGLYPFIDASSGGCLDGMIAAADAMLKLADADTKFIPGHGPVSGRAELRDYRDMLAGVRDAVKPLVAAGKTVEEVVAARPTRGYDEKYGKGFFQPDLFVRMVCGCLGPAR